MKNTDQRTTRLMSEKEGEEDKVEILKFEKNEEKKSMQLGTVIHKKNQEEHER